MVQSTDSVTDEQVYEQQLRELLASEKLPTSISEIRFELGTDHIGEPAVRVFLFMDPEFQANFDHEKARLKQLQDYSFALESKILKMDSTYFPFVNLAGAK